MRKDRCMQGRTTACSPTEIGKQEFIIIRTSGETVDCIHDLVQQIFFCTGFVCNWASMVFYWLARRDYRGGSIN